MGRRKVLKFLSQNRFALCTCARNFAINPLTPASNCPRPTPNFRVLFGIFQSEQKHKNKPYAQ